MLWGLELTLGGGIGAGVGVPAGGFELLGGSVLLPAGVRSSNSFISGGHVLVALRKSGRNAPAWEGCRSWLRR